MQIEDSLLDQKPKKTLFSLPTSILQRDWLPNIFLYQKPLKVSTEILNINDHSYVSGSQKRPMDILCGWEDAVHCGKLLHKLFLSVTEKTCWDRAKLPFLCVCVFAAEYSHCVVPVLTLHNQRFHPPSVLSRHPGKKMRKTCGPTIGPKEVRTWLFLRNPYSPERKTSSDIANHRYKGFILYVFINLLLDHVLWFLMSWL